MIRLPTILTLARLAAAPVVALLVLWGDSWFFERGAGVASTIFAVALALFIVAALTDLLDGYLARKMNATTDLGAALDHAADKALTACTLLALAKTSLPADMTIAAVLIVSRDVMMAGLREGLALSGRALPVSQGGKFKTVAVMLGAGAALATQTLIYFSAPLDVVSVIFMVARGALWAGAALAVITGAIYLRDAFKKAAA